MSQQATDLPVTVPAPPSPSEAEALTRSAEAIAAVLAAGGTRDGACAALAHEACRLLNWKRCSIFVRDDETGAYVGRLSFRTDRTDSDARVARVVCATAADRFAQEVISTRWPLLIRDAQNDPRPVRAAMVRWGVRTILGVPLLAADEVVGLLFVDDPDVLRDYDTGSIELAAWYGRLGGMALSEAIRGVERNVAIAAAQRQTESLRQHVAIQDRLMSLVRDGATVWDLARVAAALTGNPCVVQDAEGRVVALHRRPGPPDRQCHGPPTRHREPHRDLSRACS